MVNIVDSNCANWNSMGICSHCVAVAHVNGELFEFVAAKGKQKKTPNVSRLLVTGMPRGRGRKGGVPSRSKKQYQEISRRIEMNVGHVGQMAADSYVEEGNISLHNSPYSTVFLEEEILGSNGVWSNSHMVLAFHTFVHLIMVLHVNINRCRLLTHILFSSLLAILALVLVAKISIKNHWNHPMISVFSTKIGVNI